MQPPDPLISAATRRKVGIATLRRLHGMIAEEAEERRRLWRFTRSTGIAALLLVVLLALALFGSRL